MIKMIDTHAHLDLKQFNKDREKVITRCFKRGIKKIINISLDLSLLEKHENIYGAVGYHPEADKSDLEKLKALAGRPKIVAIGEIGLDKSKISNLKSQISIFQKQLALAEKFKLPIILHCRKAHEDLINILNTKYKIQNTLFRGVIHCFTGSFKQAQKYLNLGFYLSFTGLITYDRGYDKVILNTPLEKILLETDCPFLAPGPYRGQRCEPWMVKFTAQKIAEIKNISFDKVVSQTTKNAEKLFKI